MFTLKGRAKYEFGEYGPKPLNLRFVEHYEGISIALQEYRRIRSQSIERLLCNIDQSAKPSKNDMIRFNNWIK